MAVKKKSKKKTTKPKRTGDPLDHIEWVHRDSLDPNDYNPNKVFSAEMDLLKLSILKTGWTFPIVRDANNRIIDGFHRWTLSGTPEFMERWGGLVPVVTIHDITEADRIAMTVRHNRARGMHAVLRMSEIVVALLDEGLSREEVCTELGMEMEEVMRLSDVRSMPDIAGDRDTFGRAWRPKR